MELLEKLIEGAQRIDPSFGFTLLVWVLVIWGLWFFTTKWWVWYTGVYMPAKMKSHQDALDANLNVEKEQTQLMATLRDTVVELKVIAGQQLILSQKHDGDAQRRFDQLLTMIPKNEAA